MANPYDFTSGYFQAQDLGERRKEAIERKRQFDETITESKRAAGEQEKFRTEFQGGYYKTESEKNAALARRYSLESDDLQRRSLLTSRIQPFIIKEIDDLDGTGIKSKSGSIDFNNFGQGFKFGFKPEEAPSDYGMPTADFGLKFGRKYNDGTLVDARESMQDADQMSGSGGGAAPAAAQPKSPIQMLADVDPKKAETITRNVFGMDSRKLAKLSNAFSLMDFASGKSTSKDFLENQLNLQKMQSEGLGRATQQALLKNYDEAKILFGQFGKDDGKDIDKFETILLSNPVPGNPKNVKDTYEAIRIKYKDGSNMVYDPRRLMADALGQEKLQEMQEKVASNLRQTGASVYHTDAINSQTAETAKGRLAAKAADLTKDYQTQLSLDFNAEITRQLNMFTDAKNIDAKTPDGRMALEKESARINGELSGIASTAAANIGMLDNRITFRQAQAAMQKKEMAVDKNGQPILKEANSQIYAMTTSGVFLPFETNTQQGNPAAPPPPAAPAAPVTPQVQQQRTQAVPSGPNPYTTTSRSKGTSLNQTEIDSDLKAYQILKADPRVGGKLKTQELNRLELKLKAAGAID